MFYHFFWISVLNLLFTKWFTWIYLNLPEWPHTRCEACRGRKITYLNPPKLVILNFELQRRFAANYLFRQCIPGNDYTLWKEVSAWLPFRSFLVNFQSVPPSQSITSGKEGNFWYSLQTMHDLMRFQQVTPLSSLFQRCQITLLQPLLIWQLSQWSYHLGSTMLDLFKCVYILLQIWGPCLYAVLQMWSYCCLVDWYYCVNFLVADGSSELS